MTTALTIRESRDVTVLVDAFTRGRSPETLRAYVADLGLFAGHVGAPSPTQAIEGLLGLPHGDANLVLHNWRGSLIEHGLSPSTINRHMSSLRSLIKFARAMGYTNWRPEVESVRSQSLRDTAGPGVDGVKALLDVAALSSDPRKAARDVAIIRLMFDLGLRRGEIASLDMDHVELARSRILVLGKGRLERVPMALPPATVAALSRWLVEREAICKPAHLPLFVALSGPTAFQRLTGKGMHGIISELGEAIGRRVRPHGIRHASVTAVLDNSNGNLRLAQRHARHASANTTLRYDDNRTDMAGEAAKLVSELV